MSSLRKIIAWIWVFAITISMLCVPSFASSGSSYEQKTVPFWDWFVRLGGNYNILGQFLGYTSGTVCLRSDDGYHHANTNQVDFGDGTYRCICTYCGHEFTAYESDLQQSYNDYVGTLPSTIYDSTGALSWKIIPYAGYTFVTDVQRYSDYVYATPTASSSYPLVDFILNEDFKAPINGTYDLSVVTLGENFVISTTLFSNYHNYGKMIPAGQVVAYKGTASGDLNSKALFQVKFYGKNSYWYGYAVISCTPASTGNAYVTTTRPTGITGGNYGIVGDNGQITTVVDNSTIINETNNTYYNPATGQKETITSWTYDYSDRSYHITLESGDTVTVTYGDQNITINQGGNTYNIYYIIDGGCVDPDPGPSETLGPSETPGPSDAPDPTDPPHYEHSWKETGRTDPTCTAPGQIKYTCERCGMTQVEVIPATGHTWQQKQFVPTTYDDEGNLIQQGYTIYECSVCGEQYKDMVGAGPPSSSGGSSSNGDSIWSKLGELLGTILGGILGLIEAVISKILDALISLGEMLMDKLAAVVEVVLTIFEEVPKLFGGFLDFLAALFPFIPEEIMLLLTFGIVAVVFIGIIKAIRR